jgi:hypothetical protein
MIAEGLHHFHELYKEEESQGVRILPVPAAAAQPDSTMRVVSKGFVGNRTGFVSMMRRSH